MMGFAVLVIKSLRNRKFTAIVTVLSISFSVALLLGVERIRQGAQTSFTNTVSGTDLIVGARTSPVQLLLATVFGLGNTTNNISWQNYQTIGNHPAVAWTIPISLGDTHAGFRIVGTTKAYFEHYRYSGNQALDLSAGSWFQDQESAVLGAEAAEKLGYALGDKLVVAHGSGEVSFIKHDSHPFTTAGILAVTGTPVDRAIFISLAGMDAIHAEIGAGGQQEHDPVHAALLRAGRNHENEHAKKEPKHQDGHGDKKSHAHQQHERHSEPKSITAFLVGLKNRSQALSVQRMVNQFKAEPLSAVLPAMALLDLWEVVGIVEYALLVISGFVVLVGISGMLAAIMTSLDERRREMAILRAVGARPAHIMSLIVGEAVLVTAAGVLSGVAVLSGISSAVGPFLTTHYGFQISSGLSTPNELLLIGAVFLAGLLAGLLPGYRIYRFSLMDGMTVRV